MKKSVIISAFVGVFMIGTASGFAASNYKEVKALLYPSVKVDLNGQEVSNVKALMHEGTLYLPVKSMTDYFGLTSKLEFNKKDNKITIGGPKYLNLFNRESNNFYQVMVNGNWGATYQTNERKMVSNYYMGVDIFLQTIDNSNLEQYTKAFQQKLSSIGYTVSNETNRKIAGENAKVLDYKTDGSIGKIAILHKDDDFVTIMFFADKTRYKKEDMKEFDNIVKSFTIQQANQ